MTEALAVAALLMACLSAILIRLDYRTNRRLKRIKRQDATPVQLILVLAPCTLCGQPADPDNLWGHVIACPDCNLKLCDMLAESNTRYKPSQLGFVTEAADRERLIDEIMGRNSE